MYTSMYACTDMRMYVCLMNVAFGKRFGKKSIAQQFAENLYNVPLPYKLVIIIFSRVIYIAIIIKGQS